MVAVLTVADYRDSESWNQARLAVYAILAFTESFSRRNEHRKRATNIEHLSIAVLAIIAKGFEGTGDKNFLTKAANTIERLEQELRRAKQRGALNDVDTTLLKENLEAVKISLKHIGP